MVQFTKCPLGMDHEISVTGSQGGRLQTGVCVDRVDREVTIIRGLIWLADIHMFVSVAPQLAPAKLCTTSARCTALAAFSRGRQG